MKIHLLDNEKIKNISKCGKTVNDSQITLNNKEVTCKTCLKSIIDIDKAIKLYQKYQSMNRAALSLGCSGPSLKKVLVENGVEIIKYKAAGWDVKFGTIAK